MTPLRQKMEADLRLRNLAPTTGACYVRQVARFARHFGRCPSQLGACDVRTFLLHLKELGRVPATLVVYHAALRFLYAETLGQPEVMATVPRPRVRSTTPRRPLVREEVSALLDAAASSPWTYTVIATLLATGLRVSEMCALLPGDITLEVSSGRRHASCTAILDHVGCLLVHPPSSTGRADAALAGAGHDARRPTCSALET